MLGFGRPILASLSGAGADVILESGAGLISEPGNSNMLSDNIVKFLHIQNTELARMGESGRNFYKNNFDKNILIKKLECILKSEVERNPYS